MYFCNEETIDEDSFKQVISTASHWGIPMLFCCENHKPQISLIQKLSDYSVQVLTADGKNIYDVISQTQKSIDYIRTERKPHFIEYKMHTSYCPIEYLKNEMLREHTLTEAQWKKIEEAASFEMELAVISKGDQDES